MANDNNHGGARPGAGRKPKSEKYASEIEAVERGVADKLPLIRGALEKLALGGGKRVTKKRLPACLVFTKELRYDGDGNPHMLEVRAFPNAPADKLIVVEETTETMLPDRAAAIYLVDRILGKPTASVELSGPDGGEIALSSRPDPARLSLEELTALEELLHKATPDLNNGNTDTCGGAG